jgi:hypothetical protein
VNVIGLKRVGLSKLRLPGDFKQLFDLEEVHTLANSIANRGMIHEPLVRQEDWKVICGFRRVAAHFVKGWQTISCKLIECTDAEAEILQREENAIRWHDPAQQRHIIHDLVPCYERELNERLGDDPDVLRSKHGRNRSARSVAVESVANLRGVPPRTIEQALRRKGRKEKKKAIPPPIITWGLNVSPRFMQEVGAIYDQVKKAAGMADAMVRQYTMLKNSSENQLPGGYTDELRIRALSERDAIRERFPAALCPGCKGVDALQPRCPTCKALGWVTAAQMRNIQETWPALCQTEKRYVLAGNELRALTDYIPEDAP